MMESESSGKWTGNQLGSGLTNALTRVNNTRSATQCRGQRVTYLFRFHVLHHIHNRIQGITNRHIVDIGLGRELRGILSATHVQPRGKGHAHAEHYAHESSLHDDGQVAGDRQAILSKSSNHVAAISNHTQNSKQE